MASAAEKTEWLRLTRVKEKLSHLYILLFSLHNSKIENTPPKLHMLHTVVEKIMKLGKKGSEALKKVPVSEYFPKIFCNRTFCWMFQC